MLTAIRDFVHDSFGGSRNRGPRRLSSRGAHRLGRAGAAGDPGRASFAATRLGSCARPSRRRSRRFTWSRAGELEDVRRGRRAVRAQPAADLEACLKAQRQRRPGGRRGRGGRSCPLLRVALAVVARACIGPARRLFRCGGAGGGNDYLAKTRREAGDRRLGGRKARREVLRQRPARSRSRRIRRRCSRRRSFAARRASQRGNPYQGLDPELVAARARCVLEAPGYRDASRARRRRSGPGAAPHRWIARRAARSRRSRASAFDDRGLADTDAQASRRPAEDRRTLILFARGSAELPPGETAKLPETSPRISRGCRRSRRPLGTDGPRRGGRPRRQRGDRRDEPPALTAAARSASSRPCAREGLGTVSIAADGVGSARPLRQERTEEDKQLNRSVSFRVVVGTARGRAPQ